MRPQLTKALPTMQIIRTVLAVSIAAAALTVGVQSHAHAQSFGGQYGPLANPWDDQPDGKHRGLS